VTRLLYFPKWIWDERFEMTHEPAQAEPFSVTLFDRVSARYIGCGRSITVAAKVAWRKRKGLK
jgi:hypothetical protein